MEAMDIDDPLMEVLEAAGDALAAGNVEVAKAKAREVLKGHSKHVGLTDVEQQAGVVLMEVYALADDASALIGLLNELKSKFGDLSRSKQENIVKNVFSKLSDIPNTLLPQIALCEEYIIYFEKQNRPFLRQRFQTKLAGLLIKESPKQDFQKALKLLEDLVTEVKKLDDKLLLVEIFLVDSQTQFLLKNIPKARSSLTAARTNASSIYIGIELQAEIDLQAGILAAAVKDFRTSSSYFLEAFESFNSLDLAAFKRKSKKVDTSKSLMSFKYLLLSRIMGGEGDLTALLTAKNSQKYVAEASVQLLVRIGETVKKRNLKLFLDEVNNDNASILIKGDEVMETHLKNLKDELLEKNLLRIIQPYSRVEISRIAELAELEEELVLQKLSQMILDHRLQGILEQGLGELILFDEVAKDEDYVKTLDLVDSMGHVVGNLIRRARHLQAQ